MIPLYHQSPVPTAESESSADDQVNVQSGPGEERKLGCKRKRTPVETESDKSDEDLDIDSMHQHFWPSYNKLNIKELGFG